jgi:hypothetical protein
MDVALANEVIETGVNRVIGRPEDYRDRTAK